MKIIKILLSCAIVLSLGMTNPVNSMDSISETARAAKKKAKAAKKRVLGMADQILGLSTSLTPEKIYFEQALSGKLTDEQIMEKFPQGDAGFAEITSELPELPEDMKKLIITYMILLNNATTLGNAIRNIQALSLVSKGLHNMIYEDPNIYIRMIHHLSRRFGNPDYEIARLLHHDNAIRYFEAINFPWEG